MDAVLKWLGRVEPGTWSEWVGSTLTAVSLFIAFYLLLRDRRKDERAQAMRVLNWISDGDKPNTCVLHILNTSEVSIFGVLLMARPKRWWEVDLRTRVVVRIYGYPKNGDLYVDELLKGDILPAGAECVYHFPIQRYQVGLLQLTQRFRDGAGIYHTRRINLGDRPRFRGRLYKFRETNFHANRQAAAFARIELAKWAQEAKAAEKHKKNPHDAGDQSGGT